MSVKLLIFISNKYLAAMDSRPPLQENLSPQDFLDFYWLKKELATFCRQMKIPSSGSKAVLTQRVHQFLSNGEIESNPTLKKHKPLSTFDWNNSPLHLETLITNNYKSTQQVRQFFLQHIGKSFRFNVQFMNWIKSNSGKQLKDAITAYHRINAQKKSSTPPTQLAPQFEYNQYLKDFFADNPGMDRTIAIKCWKLKKQKRGTNKYHPSDLQLLSS